MNKVIFTLIFVSNFETVLTIAVAASPKAPQCSAVADPAFSPSYTRLDSSKEHTYEGVMSTTGASGQTVSVYYQKLLAEFDLFNLKAPVTIQLNNHEKAVVTLGKDFGAKILTFDINNGEREITVAEKSLLELVNVNQIENKPGLAQAMKPYYISQRYQGMGVDVALRKLAETVSGNPKRVAEIDAEFGRAYEQIKIDYMMLKKLPEVVLQLEQHLKEKKSKPTPKELEWFKKRVGSPDFMRTWTIGDQDHQITFATKGQSRILHIWTSTGEGTGLETTINLNTFDPKNPVFNFKSAKGQNQLKINSDDNQFEWSENKKPEGEELRIVFALELFKLRISEGGN